MQEEAADAKVKGLAKKVKNAEVALQRARDDLAKLMELCAPPITRPCCCFPSMLRALVLRAQVRLLAMYGPAELARPARLR